VENKDATNGLSDLKKNIFNESHMIDIIHEASSKKKRGKDKKKGG
jgi:hypothetical protein